MVDDRRAGEQEDEAPVPPAVEDVAREQDPDLPRAPVRHQRPRHRQNDQEEDREGDGREEHAPRQRRRSRSLRVSDLADRVLHAHDDVKTPRLRRARRARDDAAAAQVQPGRQAAGQRPRVRAGARPRRRGSSGMRLSALRVRAALVFTRPAAPRRRRQRASRGSASPSPAAPERAGASRRPGTNQDGCASRRSSRSRVMFGCFAAAALISSFMLIYGWWRAHREPEDVLDATRRRTRRACRRSRSHSHPRNRCSPPPSRRSGRAPRRAA